MHSANESSRFDGDWSRVNGGGMFWKQNGIDEDMARFCGCQ